MYLSDTDKSQHLLLQNQSRYRYNNNTACNPYVSLSVCFVYESLK